MYTARLARPDLLRAIGFLACHVQKWGEVCDRRLYRVLCHISSTLDHRLYGRTDGDISSMSTHVFSDADFTGCSVSNRSTTGACVILEGEHTKFPIATTNKKQTCVSLSTPEAEIVAGNWAAMQEANPI